MKTKPLERKLAIQEVDGVKLSIDQVRKFKKDFIELNGERETKGSTIMSLVDTIEALQQENDGWRERYDELDAGHSRLFKDFCKLQRENEQLQAQVARMREALKQVQHDIDGAECRDDLDGIKGYIDEAIAAIDKIGGGEDA